ncbi:MAG: Thiamine-binding periplasmic protein [Anaerolineales bacterium]|nr:Thiamine-binding periplasmic protein [Anaerolineales bacterium]
MFEARFRAIVVGAMLIVLAGCAVPMQAPATQPAEPAATEAPQTITLMSHDSFAASEDVLAQFEEENNAKLELLPSGDAGAALTQAILSKENPLADVFFGVDNTFFSRAMEAGIFEPYTPEGLQNVPDRFILDPEHRLLPVDYGDVCLNYDKAWFDEEGLEPPQNLEDLTQLEYEGLLVAENPATSSPGLAFMLATVGHFGELGDYTWLDYWLDLRDNDVTIVNGWEEAYWGQFTAASDGDKPLVVSYASSPPAEVYFAEEPLDEAPTGVVTGGGACFRQIEFIGILKGAKNRALAEKLIDFMLGKTFQEDIPLQMFVFPVNQAAELPKVFAQHAVIPENPADVSPGAIDQNRDRWIEAWTQTVLR